MTIPISQVVQVLPGVITAGGTPSRLSGMVISQDTSLPPGQAPRQFFTATDVQNWFGAASNEATIANNYFPGTVNGGQLPYVLKFAGMAATASPAGSYGAQLGAMTLTQLQALSGTLIVTVNGTQFVSSAINLATATSFANAATLMQAGFALAAPVNGALTATAGGTLAAATYFVRSTWVNAQGETLGAAETSLAVAANNVLNVAAPANPPAGATGWNVYVSTATGTETKQNTAVIALGTAWVEPTTGLIAGAALPAANTANAPFTISYDVQRNRYTLLTLLAGPTASSTDVSGTLAAGVLLNQASGAYIATAGLAADTPTSVMARVITLDTNWGTFTTAYAAVNADRLSYATWNSGQNYQYVYVGWDVDAASVQSNNAASFGAQVGAAPYQGTWPIYGTQALAGASMGAVASVNFSVPNGRTTMAFRQFNAGTAATVSDLATANALLSNGYTYLGAYANAANAYTVTYNGKVSGKFLWVDTYIDQVYLNRELQRAFWEAMLAYNSIPYNQDGYTALYRAGVDVIDAAVTAGIIRPGVILSQSQAQQIDTQAGRSISPVVSARGWYLLIGDPANVAQVRTTRGTPTAYLWYTDGGSVQSLAINSIAII